MIALTDEREAITLSNEMHFTLLPGRVVGNAVLPRLGRRVEAADQARLTHEADEVHDRQQDDAENAECVEERPGGAEGGPLARTGGPRKRVEADGDQPELGRPEEAEIMADVVNILIQDLHGGFFWYDDRVVGPLPPRSHELASMIVRVFAGFYGADKDSDHC